MNDPKENDDGRVKCYVEEDAVFCLDVVVGDLPVKKAFGIQLFLKFWRLSNPTHTHRYTNAPLQR
jgi:hypothetical protein